MVTVGTNVLSQENKIPEGMGDSCVLLLFYSLNFIPPKYIPGTLMIRRAWASRLFESNDRQLRGDRHWVHDKSNAYERAKINMLIGMALMKLKWQAASTWSQWQANTVIKILFSNCDVSSQFTNYPRQCQALQLLHFTV